MDIVERLRLSITKGHEPTDEDAIAAAAEIERLRSVIADLLSQDYAEECQECGIGHSKAWAEAKKVISDHKR